MKGAILSAVLIGLFFGILLGYGIKPTTKTEYKTVEKQVSVCDKALGSDEKDICFAKDSCGEKGVDNFEFKGNWSGAFIYNCNK